jgi:hypothetical protein
MKFFIVYFTCGVAAFGYIRRGFIGAFSSLIMVPMYHTPAAHHPALLSPGKHHDEA